MNEPGRSAFLLRSARVMPWISSIPLSSQEKEGIRSNMGWVVFLVISATVILVLMKYAGSNRRAQKAIKGKGRSPVKICDECGLPRGKCQEMKRRAEHPKGFSG